MFNSIYYSLNGVLSYFASFNTAIFLLILSILTVTFSTLVYKYFSNQTKIKSLKAQIKELTQKIKKSDPKDSLQLNNKVIKLNFELMGLTMKPSFYTIIPMMLIFIWLSAVFSQQPIMPDGNFSIIANYNSVNDMNDTNIKNAFSSFVLLNENVNDKTVTLLYKAPKLSGDYSYTLQGKEYPLVVSSKPIFFERSIKGSNFDMQIKTPKLIILNLFGWHLGYIGAYILYSIFINMIVRKIFDVH